jgi:glycosyltransferase involved in cell wall biosynthesis
MPAEPGRDSVSNAPRRLIAFAHALEDPACRFRIRQYIPYLEKARWEVSLRTRNPAYPWITPWRNPLLRAAHREAGFIRRRVRRRWDIHDAARFHAVFLNRDLLEGKSSYEAFLFQRNARVIFDFDDAIFLGEKASHIAYICERAAWVIAGNEYLAEFARRWTSRVSVIPTVIDTDQYVTASEFDQRTVRVGWLGSDQSIRETLFPHVAVLAELQRQLGFQFIIVSRPKPDLPSSSLRWDFVEWSPTVETGIARLFDIGIMPLVDEPYQRGKCGCKILQYMSAALPVVASPVGINTQLIQHGSRGLLASSPEDWGESLGKLIARPELRRTMGQAGRAFAEQHYSIRTWFPQLLAVIEAVADGRNQPRRV